MHPTLRNEQILLIGLPAWEGDYLKSTVQLAAELARHNQVLYVEYPFTWKDAMMGRMGKSNAPWRRMLGKSDRLRRVTCDNGAELHVLTLPPMLPVNFINSESLYDSLMLGNAKKAYRTIRLAMQELDIARPVAVNAFNPFLGTFLARQFHEKALIYYCYDEISAAKWAGKHGPRLEYHLMREADAVITSSQPLFDAKQPVANQTYLVKNGVDFSLFHSAAKASAAAAKKEQPLTIGYLGSLDERLDYDLLESTIKALPQHRFCFVGRVNSPQVDRLRHYKNVAVVGSQPPASLPGWVQKMDVCLIPFIKNELTAGIYPLKINEYFAAGKPVVSTHFGDLSDFHSLLSIAESATDFPLLIEKALANDTPRMMAARQEFARQNSWEKRAAEMGLAIRTIIKGNEALVRRGEYTWMPNNYNRWGEASAQFFKSGQSDQNEPAAPTGKTTPASKKRRVNIQGLVLLPSENT